MKKYNEHTFQTLKNIKQALNYAQRGRASERRILTIEQLLILSAISVHQPTTKANIDEYTAYSITKDSINTIVSDLLNMGYIEQTNNRNKARRMYSLSESGTRLIKLVNYNT